MQANIGSTNVDFSTTWTNNEKYFDMLCLMASLSKLFSENSIPYLDYRLAENLFCKYYEAINDARSCTAYDARLGHLGIGIKTFGIPHGHSIEKIAEFNKLKRELDPLHGDELARKLAEFRNDRMEFSNGTYDVNMSLYHIVGRQKGKLVVFNSPYEKIDVDKIGRVNDTDTSISFYDGDEYYTFNKSKSVLQKQFVLPEEHRSIDVDIIEDPLELLSRLLSKKEDGMVKAPVRVKGLDYLVLPLYSEKKGERYVPQKSGLNQWNAGGRKRDANEVYIPVPMAIHHSYPNFFPNRDVPFLLQLPHGELMSAKLCQDNSKALMSNPNSALGEWLLRKVLRKKEGDLVKIADLDRYGIDSVMIENLHKEKDGVSVYKILFMSADYERYSEFIDEE